MESFSTVDLVMRYVILTALFVGVWLLLRKVTLWYFKIDRIEALLQGILAELQRGRARS